MTQFLIVISASVIPLDDLAKALRLSTWPTNVTNTVTNDISIVFANKAVRTDAVEGCMPLLEEILCPHLG
jgi:hypothetical protein